MFGARCNSCQSHCEQVSQRPKNSGLNRITFTSLLHERNLVQMLCSSGSQGAFHFAIFCCLSDVVLTMKVQDELQASHPCFEQEDGRDKGHIPGIPLKNFPESATQ